jgi:hypothetical protein
MLKETKKLEKEKEKEKEKLFDFLKTLSNFEIEEIKTYLINNRKDLYGYYKDLLKEFLEQKKEVKEVEEVETEKYEPPTKKKITKSSIVEEVKPVEEDKELKKLYELLDRRTKQKEESKKKGDIEDVIFKNSLIIPIREKIIDLEINILKQQIKDLTDKKEKLVKYMNDKTAEEIKLKTKGGKPLTKQHQQTIIAGLNKSYFKEMIKTIDEIDLTLKELEKKYKYLLFESSFYSHKKRQDSNRYLYSFFDKGLEKFKDLEYYSNFTKEEINEILELEKEFNK